MGCGCGEAASAAGFLWDNEGLGLGGVGVFVRLFFGLCFRLLGCGGGGFFRLLLGFSGFVFNGLFIVGSLVFRLLILCVVGHWGLLRDEKW